MTVTRSQAEQFEFVLTELFKDTTKGSLFRKVLAFNHIDNVSGIVDLEESDLQRLTYDDYTGKTRTAPIRFISLLRLLKSYHFYLLQTLMLTNIEYGADTNIISATTFQEYHNSRRIATVTPSTTLPATPAVAPKTGMSPAK